MISGRPLRKLGIVLLAFVPWESAQSQDGPVATLQNALRFLDSRSPEDLAWSESELQKIAKNHKQAATIGYAVSLSQFGQAQYSKTAETLSSVVRQPELPTEVRSQVGILQLYSATNTDDKEVASRLFQALKEATLRDSVPLLDRKRYASVLGELVGLLEPEPAKSPIDANLLRSVKADVSRCGNAPIEIAFRASLDAASLRSKQLETLNEEFQVGGVEGLEKKLAELQGKLIEKQEESKTQRESTEEAKDNNAEATKQLRLERRRVEQEISEVTLALRTPTPNHPGPAIPPPVRPNINNIQVDEFQAVVVVDSRGRSSTVLQRRPQFEIDRDRNFQLQLLEGQYTRNLELHRNYQAALARWEKADRDRRKELLDRKSSLQETLKGLTFEIEKLSDASKSVALEFREVREEEKKLRGEIEILEDFLAAAKQGKPELAFRPLRLRADEIGYQKTKLVRLLSAE